MLWQIILIAVQLLVIFWALTKVCERLEKPRRRR